MRGRVRRILAFFWHAWMAHAQAVLLRMPVRSNTVLYESFAGNGQLCNPEALFRELMRSSDLAHLRHIWVVNGHARTPQKSPRVRTVRYRSLGYFRALATSGYLVNNATFPPEFVKRPEQIYLNTWHGTPLKRMGYDMPNGAAESANTLRNFVSADYLLSQSPFMTKQMYELGYKLGGAFGGTVIEAGYPRVDRQFMTADERSAARELLERAGMDLRGRKIVLYAPTWTGPSFSAPEKNLLQLMRTVDELQAKLGDTEYVVLLKPHQIIGQGIVERGFTRLLSNDIPTNTVLGCTDVLITDFSSIFFDFLASDRPIVFYRPQETDAYLDQRGAYFAAEELPGAVSTSVEQVATAIVGADSDLAGQRRRAEWKQRFLPGDDGHAAGRVIDTVFRGIVDAHKSVAFERDSRTSLLLHLGSMNTNGITSSALNLLRAIDHRAFDVSVVFNRPSNAQQRDNQRKIDPRVRQFHRAGGMNGTLFDRLYRRFAEISGRDVVHTESTSQRRMWDNEWRRCFGATTFDRVIDFDGYGPFWATMLLHGPDARRSIWMHNQMDRERHRLIRGRERLKRSLGAVFGRYREFDALVSVSPSLARLNQLTLAERLGIEPERFVSARNVIDPLPIVEAAQHSVVESVGDPRPKWLSDLAHGTETTWFVTLGRFSTEKNQSRLIRAFATVHSESPATRLLLIGYGPLRVALERLIDELGITDSAYLVGPLENPFPLLGAADCFVLSSDYEGQPMVLMEAALLGLPIVTVAFSTVADALPVGSALIVDQTDDALAEGMRAFLSGAVGRPHVDVEEYAREAILEFDVATSGTGGRLP
ncbi:MAG: CDP-glycerol glycerophosphotransferase [Microbacteriaceae bacterium]|nr:CDP-glycerol glycerophosphotransferase [Microbacteriaceae bacterium]